MNKDKRLRNFCFTLNNYKPQEIDILHKMPQTYLVIGYETCPTTGTPHLQGYWEGPQIRWEKIKKILPRMSFEPRCKDATSKRASDYCKKGEQTKEEWKKLQELGPNFGLNAKFEEYGELSKPGKRTDLDIIANQIATGVTNVSQILTTEPETYHQYGRTLEKLEELANKKKYRTWMTECEWITGPTGAGKSHRAFEGYNPDTHYVHNLEDNGWWDNYDGQEIVIINDFKGEIKYGTMLQLVDKWPYTVKRRNRAPVPFLAKKVIITSIMKPEDCYFNLHSKDGIEQLMRRISVSEVVSEVVTGNIRL